MKTIGVFAKKLSENDVRALEPNLTSGFFELILHLNLGRWPVHPVRQKVNRGRRDRYQWMAASGD